MRPIHQGRPARSNSASGSPDEHEISRFARIKRGLSTAIGAAVALALLATVGNWLYGLSVRDAGEVPIIRAATTPAKVRPEDPGGAVTPYQDITSYQVAADEPVEPEAVALAPPPPEPREEDVAMGGLAPAPAERPKQGAADDRLALAGDAGKAALAAAAQPDAPVADGSDFAPALSPIAPRRPADLESRMAEAVVMAEIRADALARKAAASEIQVQLAAAPKEDTVRQMWQRISRANADILHDRELAVQSTVSGGSTLYRLRVGPFGDAAEARAVCEALRSRGQDCIIARNG